MTQKLLNDIKEAANILKDMKESQINILTHYDADGLCDVGDPDDDNDGIIDTIYLDKNNEFDIDNY